MGVLFQLNLASVTGYYGESARKKAEFILNKGWYRYAGSDCHRLSSLQKQYSRKAVTRKIINQIRQIL